MPLFEVETENHIVITWAEDGDAASAVVGDAYPQEHVMRLTKRPRDTWVISKSALGISRARWTRVTRRAIVWLWQKATKFTPSDSTCRRPAPISNRRAKRSNRIWSWAGDGPRVVDAGTRLGSNQ